MGRGWGTTVGWAERERKPSGEWARDRPNGPIRLDAPGARREGPRPDPCQGDLVLDAVKAWPGSVGKRRTRGATASLDRVSARGQRQIMGRDEETGFSGRTKKPATSSCFFVRPQAVSSS